MGWVGGVLECDELEEVEECEEDEEEEDEEVPLKVVPMSPNLMLEKVTDEDGAWDSIWAGTPEVVEQFPRAIPGWVAGDVVG